MFLLFFVVFLVFFSQPIFFLSYSAIIVETDVPLDGGDTLLLGDLALVGDVDKDSASLALHLDDDLGQSSLTNLLEGGQHTSAEHDLKGRGKNAGVNECMTECRMNESMNEFRKE